MSMIVPSPIEKVINIVIDHWRIAAVVALVVIVSLWAYCGGWFHRTPKLNQQEIQRAQTAIATQDRQEMTQVLAESEAREAVTDANVNEAKAQTFNAVQESKKKWADASIEDMQAELEARAKEGQ
jgi:uncharacterized membrane protein YvbJ